jgi:hypothetical protein
MQHPSEIYCHLSAEQLGVCIQVSSPVEQKLGLTPQRVLTMAVQSSLASPDLSANNEQTQKDI